VAFTKQKILDYKKVKVLATFL